MTAPGSGRPAASAASLAAALAALILLVAGNQDYGTNAQSTGASTPASYGDVAFWASLTVDSQLRNQTKNIGDRVQFDCEITGYPTPRYTWYKDEVEISVDERVSASQRFKVQPQDWGSRLRIDTLTASDVGLYRCVASNPRGSVETAAFLRVRTVAAGGGPTSPSAGSAVRQSTVGIDHILSPNIIDDDRWLKFAANAQQQQQLSGDDDDVNPYCQDYKGTYCNLLKDQQIYVTSRKSQHLADQRIMRMINDLGQPAINSRQCYTRVLEAVCYNQMPPCALDGLRRPYPRRLCKSDCEDIVAVCRNEFAGSPKAWRLLPNCAELSDLDGCIRMGASGEQGDRDGAQEAGAAGGKESHSGDVPFVIIIPSAVGGVVIVVVVTVLCIRRRSSNRKRRGSGSRQRKPKTCEDDSDHSMIGKERDGKAHELLLLSRNGSSTGGSSSDRTPLPLSAAAAATSTTSNSISQVPYVKDVALNNIHFVEELGEGQFGKIYRAQVFGLYGSGTATTVLAKTLVAPPVAPAAVALAFRREIDDMVELRHQHVALLLGVSLGGSPQCALYEHLPFGDLKQFLCARAPSPPPLPLSGGAGGGGSSVDSGQLYIGAAAAAGLQTPELLYVATQVASALEYLAGARRRHGDVAARNVLVGQNLSVKLSNLGVSRGPYAGDYCLLHDRLLPVRWLPPEVITYGQPSHEADVYSFGVLLWELFTFGQQPYSGHNNHEVMELIRSRHLLTCPPAAPTRIYSLMVECWHEAPAKRPSARELHQRLRAWYLDAASAPPIISAADALGSGCGSGSGAGAGRVYKSSSKSSSSAASSAGSSAGTPSAGVGIYSPRGGPNVAGPGVVDPLTGGGGMSSGSSGGSNGLDGSTVPLLQGQRLLPPSSPSYVTNGSAVVPPYYSQPLPYVACTTPTSLSAPSSAGFDIKPATPVDRGGSIGGSSTATAAAAQPMAPFPDDLAQQSYVETQVDFPHRRAVTGNDYV